MNAHTSLRVLLLFIALFHLAMGTGLAFSLPFQQFLLDCYGSAMNLSTQTSFFLRIIGSFACVLGYLSLVASKNPDKHRQIIFSIVGFFILRNILRHLYADEVYVSLGITVATNILTSIFFGMQALLLLLLYYLSLKQQRYRYKIL